MPRGPQGQNRPADVIGCVITTAKIFVGDVEKLLTPPSGNVGSGLAGALERPGHNPVSSGGDSAASGRRSLE
jgi:hypothetical protein